jgi:hypothetical protein
MRSRYVDTTNQYDPAARNQWQRKGAQEWRLLHELEGTFCFPVSDIEAGCGDPLQMTLSKSQQLSASFGVQGFSISASTTSSVSHTQTHKTKKCETCSSVACYRNSRLREYAVRNRWFGGEWTISNLDTGSGLLLTADCQPEPECPGCEGGESDGFLASRPAVAEMQSSPGRYARTAAFDGPTGQLAGVDTEWLGAAKEIVDGFGEPLGNEREGGGETSDVVVAQPGGYDVPLNELHSPSIALLSFDARDELIGGMRLRQDGLLPILAAAPALPSTTARVTLIRAVNEEWTGRDWRERERLFRFGELGPPEAVGWRDLSVAVGRFTTFFGIVDAAKAADESPDGTLALILELRKHDQLVDRLFVPIVA